MRRKSEDANVLNPERNSANEMQEFEHSEIIREQWENEGIVHIIVPKRTSKNLQSEISQLAIKVRLKARKKASES